jgi:hypothetical protein
MLDVLDIFALVVIAVLLAAVVIAVVGLGSLPGAIARKRGHPQAAAVNAASWLGIATLGLLWPLAFVWAFTNRRPPRRSNRNPRPTNSPTCRLAWTRWNPPYANAAPGRRANRGSFSHPRLLGRRAGALQAEAD